MRERLEPLIAERAPWLFEGRLDTRLARALLVKVLCYEQSVRLGTLYETWDADHIMKHIAGILAQDVKVSGLENLPRQGPALIVANHPTGIADGVMLHHAITRIRPDLFIFANADILRLLPQFGKMIAPVEWREEKRSREKTRETIEYTRAAIEAGRLGVIFPSGRLAKRRWLGLHERPWMPSAAMIAKKYDLPIIPLHISSRNSALFYIFDAIHPTLRDITLFRELLNKDRQHYCLTIGEAISASTLPAKSEDGIALLRGAVLRLGNRQAPRVSISQYPQVRSPTRL